MGFLNGRITFTRFRVSGPGPLPFGDEIIEQARGTHHRPLGRGPCPRRHRRGLGRGRPCPRPDARPGQEHHRRCAPPGRPDRHRQDSRLPPACVHPDGDRRPGPEQPERLPDQGPAAGGEGGGPRPRRGRGVRRPVPPDEALPGPLGRPRQRRLRRDQQHGEPRPPADALPRDLRPPPRADHRRQPGVFAGRDAGPGADGRRPRAGPLPGRRRGLCHRRLGRQRLVEPRLPGQRVPALALAHLAVGRRHADPARRLGSDRHARQDPDPGLPARRDRPRLPDRRGPDPPPRGLPRPPGGQAAAQGRADRGPRRRPVRIHAPGRDPGRQRRLASPAPKGSPATTPSSPGSRASDIWSRRSTSCTMPTACAGPAPSGMANSAASASGCKPHDGCVPRPGDRRTMETAAEGPPGGSRTTPSTG